MSIVQLVLKQIVWRALGTKLENALIRKIVFWIIVHLNFYPTTIYNYYFELPVGTPSE